MSIHELPWTKKNYIKSRTEYWRREEGLSKKLAEDCAEFDWQTYLEKYWPELASSPEFATRYARRTTL